MDEINGERQRESGSQEGDMNVENGNSEEINEEK